MSLSCHGLSPLPMGGLWNFIPQMAQVDRLFLLNRPIVQAAFQVMKGKLKFNICDIASSHHLNNAIPKSQILAAIPPFLSYSCCFWGHHLKEVFATGATCETSKDGTALTLLDVESFMKDQLLF